MRSSPVWLAFSWVVGGLAVACVELWALGSARPSLVWTVSSLFMGLGLVCGAFIALVEYALRAARARGLVAAASRALVVLPGLAWASAHLFDGGMASTLPGASLGHIWVPALGFAGVAVALVIAGRMARTRAGGLVACALALLSLAVVEYGNRGFLVREYADVHAFLTLASVLLAGAAVYLGARAAATVSAPTSATIDGWPASVRAFLFTRRARLAALALAGALAVSVVLAILWGLSARADRWTVATRGMHARQLARVLRDALDLDGDGYARALGGGDCDDRDARTNPAAEDTPGDGRDQDCDGADAELATAVEDADTLADRRRALDAWLAGPEVSALVARVRGYHILIISVDALRADLLEPTAENRAELPNLVALAGDARWFARAFAPASGTDYSLGSLLTGRVDPYVPMDTTLIEALAALGYATHAVLPREVMRWAGAPLITRGFASHDVVITDKVARDVGSHSSSAEITALCLASLDARRAARPGARTLSWLHYFDVHEHHQLGRADLESSGVALDPNPDKRARYRAVARIVDRELGRLKTELEARGLWHETVVILLSDHGEGLGEDARLPDTHGRFVYNPLVHVPLAIRVPGLPPARIDAPVSLIDVAPTVLALLGHAPLPGMHGRSLLPWLLDDDSPGPASERARSVPIPLNETEQHGVIDWPYKLMMRPGDNLVELYDLVADFAEAHDLSADRPELVQRLRTVYRDLPPVLVDRSLKARKRRDQIARPGNRP